MKNIFGTLAFAILASSPMLSGLYARGAAGDSQAKTDRFPQAGPTKVVTDHARHEVEIPVNPQRIASLHYVITSMLYELGAPIIGSSTRTKKPENITYLRGTYELYGLKFEDTGWFNYGASGKDTEQVKASKPDVIVASIYDAKSYDLLSQIAPTVLLNYGHEQYRDLAGWIGKSEVFLQKNTQYEKELEDLKAKFHRPLEGKTYVYLTASTKNSTISVHPYYGAMSKVAEDLGLVQHPSAVKLNVEYSAKVSPETISDFNADFLLSTYRAQYGDTAEDFYASMDAVAPGWRSFMGAVANNNIVLGNRELSYTSNFETYKHVIREFSGVAK